MTRLSDDYRRSLDPELSLSVKSLPIMPLNPSHSGVAIEEHSQTSQEVPVVATTSPLRQANCTQRRRHSQQSEGCHLPKPHLMQFKTLQPTQTLESEG